MTKPSGKLEFAYRTIAALEQKLEAAQARVAELELAKPLRGMDLVDHVQQLIEGKTVSVDVSTGEHDAGNRLFAKVVEVMHDGADEFVILTVDPEPNFESQVAQAGQVPEKITDAMNAAGLKADKEFHRCAADRIDCIFKAMLAAAPAQGGE